MGFRPVRLLIPAVRRSKPWLILRVRANYFSWLTAQGAMSSLKRLISIIAMCSVGAKLKASAVIKPRPPIHRRMRSRLRRPLLLHLFQRLHHRPRKAARTSNSKRGEHRQRLRLRNLRHPLRLHRRSQPQHQRLLWPNLHGLRPLIASHPVPFQPAIRSPVHRKIRC